MKTEETQVEHMDAVELNVAGMTCGACERHVRQALITIPGVSGVNVSRATASATVEVNGAVDVEALVAAVRAAGYDASVARTEGASAPHSPDPAGSRCGCGG